MASFEESLSSRLTVGKSDPEETDLDYYAKPENYTGSNLHAMQRLMFVQKKQGLIVDTNSSNDDPMDRLRDRYRDIGVKITVDSLGDGRQSGTRRDSSASLYSSGSQPKKVTVVEKHTGSTEETSHNAMDKSKLVFDMTGLDRSDAVSDTLGGVDGPSRKLSVGSKLSTVSGPYRSARSSTTASLKELNTLLAKERFRHAIKLIIILLKWISTLTEKEGEEEPDNGGKTFTDIATDAFKSSGLNNSDLTFDLTQFKAKKEINISNEVKYILSTPSASRTPEQLQTVLYGLQHLHSFAEYPLHMQEKLCEVAWFQQVPPKRVIIRQGHFAENFYFILSGQVVVRILDKNQKTGDVQLRTAAVMKKGMSFGELALLHHSRRTATVVSHDLVQLLTIGRDDFFDIFMSRTGADDMPEHIRFVSNLEFMKGWPIDRLLEHPESCLFHFFKRGVVIVKDSHHSDWLYIVKSGSCQVMKQLKGVVPSPPRKNNDLLGKYALRLPQLGTDMFAAKVNTGIRKASNPLFNPSTLTRALTDYDGFRRKHASKTKQAYSKSINFGEERQHMSSSCSPVFQTESVKPGFSKSRFPTFAKAQKPHFSAGSSRPERAKSATTIRTRISIKGKSSPDRHSNGPPIDIKGPVFVQVEVLKPKDVFGLSTIQFDEDFDSTVDNGTSVSLVSNGAECIMFSKKFFADKATDQVKRLIRQMVRPYPSEETLQGNLQTKVDWDVYKKQLLRDMVNHKRQLANSFKVSSIC